MRLTDERLENLKMETLEQMREKAERLEKLRMETEKFKIETFEQMRLTDQRIEKRIGKLTDAQGLFWESLPEKV